MNRRATQTARAASLLFATLACLPFAHAQSGPPQGHRKPPPEAFTACQGKSKAADCTVTFHDKTLEGICVLEDQAALFCMPHDMPAPPAGGHGGPPPDR